jgi:GDP-L-fucose synthase
MSGERRTVLVTGASGFIGKNLVEQLADEFTVLGPRHAELELLDEEAVAAYLGEHRVDFVVHSAVKPGHRNAADPTGLVAANTRMFFNLARLAGRYERMIFLSSGAAYDMRHYQPKMAEEYFDTHVPADELGFSKYLCGKYVEHAERIVELRPFGVFGKYEDWEIRFMSNAICKTLFDVPVTLRQNRRFDYIWVDDLVTVVRHFLREEGREKAYNVTPDAAVELRTLAEKVVGLSGKKLPVVVATEGRGVEYSGDNRRLRAEIPDLRLTPLDAALGRLYQWYAEHRGLIKYEALLADK